MKTRDTIFLLLATIILSLSFFASSIQVPAVEANPSTDLPKRIHLTYQDDPATSIVVTWQTTNPAVGDVVLYDTDPHGGDSSLYTHSAVGLHHTYSGASGYIHSVELTSLRPDTSYYFICGGPGNYSEERAFITAPRLVSDFAFVVGGDSRTNPDDRTKVSEAMRYFDPAFVLHSGDMVEDGSTQSLWDTWFTDLEENWVGDNGYTIPIIPCLGNHERNATNYYEQFALPGNEQWYYYDWGPTLRIIVLNSEATASQITTDQTNWLRRVLYSTPEHKWKIVMFHRNIYSSGGHSNATDLITYWMPLFDKYNVDIVLQGHTHHYHRSKPMKNNTRVSSYDNGTMYLTSGAWGAPLYDYIEQPYSAYGKKALHFTLFRLYQNGTLHLEAKDITGSTFDKVTLYKNVSEDATHYRPPEADAGENRVIDEDVVNIFDGSNSLNSTEIMSYSWAFMDSTPQTLSGMTVDYSFTNPGIYAVTLNVSDARGEFNTETITVTVHDVTPPVANAGMDQQVKVNVPIAFNASGSNDNVGIVSYEWDFGDGVTGTGAKTTHTYTNSEQYAVTLTVVDAAGNSDIGVIKINVEVEQTLPGWTFLVIGAVILVFVAVVYRLKYM
jgi:PKD repeat protein